MKGLSAEQVREQAKIQNWVFVRERLLPLGGYWRDSAGQCYYAKKERGK
jgi:hypothetical protein